MMHPATTKSAVSDIRKNTPSTNYACKTSRHSHHLSMVGSPVVRPSTPPVPLSPRRVPGHRAGGGRGRALRGAQRSQCLDGSLVFSPARCGRPLQTIPDVDPEKDPVWFLERTNGLESPC